MSGDLQTDLDQMQFVCFWMKQIIKVRGDRIKEVYIAYRPGRQKISLYKVVNNTVVMRMVDNDSIEIPDIKFKI